MVESGSHLLVGPISMKGFMGKTSIFVTDVHQYEKEKRKMFLGVTYKKHLVCCSSLACSFIL
jgi:hypothetical protein